MLRLLVFIFIGLVFSCKTSQNITNADQVEEIVFDTIDVSAADMDAYAEMVEILPYNPSATRSYDLLHTKLILSFDWENQHVLGKAELTLTPIFKDLNSIALNAKGMLIHSVKNAGSKKDLPFNYENNVLEIGLDKELKKGEDFIVFIDYTARPNATEGYSSGAITSDKGLFFIDPLENDPNKPTQIWTQGETENNSRWFPTFDKPNERCSQEMYITVDNKYTTLSNGKLMSSATNSDGTRTDYWKQEKPHAPYLFMLAIGEFAWVNDKWNQIPLHYIVEKEYEESAKQIFDHTPEMLTYFSEILDYPYPWDKYAQIITRDYVSGAMENTSAVIFGEFVQKHERELIDNDNDYIVAHEMFHHWFGDLVTCESWANLTLNEGFANYSEYLWAEHKEGRMKADHHRLNEMQGYLTSGDFHPLIHYRYGDKEDMFDAHSYNKGGLVLHMLRNYVGDEAFFASLSKYLKDNAFTAVEVDELRMAFEDTIGEDLNWFFDQWYLTEGHPVINVKYDYQVESKTLNVFTFQVGTNNFTMPFNLAVYDKNGIPTFHKVWIQNEMDTITLSNILEPSNYILDGTNTALAVITEDEKTDEQFYSQFNDSELFYDKFYAFNSISFDSKWKIEVVKKALEEEYYLFKEMALEFLMQSQNSNILSTDQATDLVLNDKHSQVRFTALEYLMAIPDFDASVIVGKILENERAYPILALCLGYMSTVNYEKAVTYADKLKLEKTNLLDEGLSVVFSQSEEHKYEAWFKDKIIKNDIFNALPIYLGYTNYSLKHNPENVSEIISGLNVKALDFSAGVYQRYFATMILSNIKSLLEANYQNEFASEATKAIKEIKMKETNSMLLGWYSQM